MSDEQNLRVMIALLLTAAIALSVYQGGNGILASVAVVVAGGGALVILLTASKDFSLALPTSPRPPGKDSTDAKAVIDAISEPVLLATDNKVRTANNAALALLGQHIVGEDIRLAIRHPDASSHFTMDAADGRSELAGFGGAGRNMEMSVTTIAPGQRVIHLVDRGTQQLVERARTDFVANASHELRTPLAAILGFVETLLDDNTGGDKKVRHHFLDVMLNEARRMQRLIDDLISLSRIESEKFMLPDQMVSVRDVVKQAVHELQSLMDAEPNHVAISIGDGAHNINGDRPQLLQLTHNLVGNAIKYGRPGGNVSVKVITEGRNVVMAVCDDGDGIPPEHLPRLTERFYRVDSGRSKTLGGTGLGLAIAKHIVERHRGRIDINSQMGVGTTVTVTFPAQPGATVT